MNDEQKTQKKLQKFSRQIGYLAFKLLNLSKRDMAQIKGNGLIITVKKWEDVVNEREYIGDNETVEKILDDKSFEEQVAKVREGWKK